MVKIPFVVGCTFLIIIRIVFSFWRSIKNTSALIFEY